MRPAGSTPLDISRMGGPQHAEREAAALRDAAERATAPRPTPVTFQDVSSHIGHQLRSLPLSVHVGTAKFAKACLNGETPPVSGAPAFDQPVVAGRDISSLI